MPVPVPDVPEPMTIDARGLLCPMPVIAIAKAAMAAPPGTAIELLADDVAAVTDVPAWARMTGRAAPTVTAIDTYWKFTVTV